MPCRRGRLIVFGHIGFDFFLDSEDDPEVMKEQLSLLDYDELLDGVKAAGLTCYNGGTAGNVAVAADKIGSQEVRIFSCCNNCFDYFDSTNVMVALFMSEKNERIPLCFIISKDEKQEAFLFDETLSAYCLIQEFNKWKDCEHIHITTLPPNPVLKLVEEIREEDPEIPISFTPGQNLNLYYWKTLHKIFQKVDILFVNEKEYEVITKMVSENPEMVIPDIIINTNGGMPTRIITKDKECYVDVCTPEQVKDTTGAGDAFSAGFLSRYMLGKDLKYCTKYGSALASFVVEEIGSQTNLPSHEEVLERMEKNYVNV